MTDPTRQTSPAATEERPAAVYGPPDSYRLRAIIALCIAVLGVGGFLVGVRSAVRRIPADAEARAAVRRDSLLRVRGGGPTAQPGSAGGASQPEELPRLR